MVSTKFDEIILDDKLGIDPEPKLYWDIKKVH
jgi:hypothetical protein